MLVKENKDLKKAFWMYLGMIQFNFFERLLVNRVFASNLRYS